MSIYRVLISYNGRRFHGWQRQPGIRTVQGDLEKALKRMNAGSAILVKGASRTDAKVHAQGQIASFEYDGKITEKGWLRGLNGLTAEDIVVREVKLMHDGFHPRFDSVGKHYRYLIWQGSHTPPQWRGWVMEVHRPLNLLGMEAASEALIGEHDFTSFRATGCQALTATRRIDRIVFSCPSEASWVYQVGREDEAGLIQVELFGSAFLKYMIRIIMGTLVEVGLGQRTVESVKVALEARKRAKAGVTGAPEGLSLIKVFYPPPGVSREGFRHFPLPEGAALQSETLPALDRVVSGSSDV